MGLAPFRQLHRIGAGARTNTSSEESVDYVSLFRAATSPGWRDGNYRPGLLGRLSRALGVGHEDIDISKSLHAFGVDLLLAAELRNYFAQEFDADVRIFDLMGGSAIEQACATVAEMSKYRQGKRFEA